MAGKAPGFAPQLARGERSRAKDGCNKRSKQYIFKIFIHTLPHFQFAGPEILNLPSGYFAGLAAMKLHVPESGKLGCAKTHAQPRMLGHPVLWVQKPRQVVWKGRYNW